MLCLLKDQAVGYRSVLTYGSQFLVATLAQLSCMCLSECVCVPHFLSEFCVILWTNWKNFEDKRMCLCLHTLVYLGSRLLQNSILWMLAHRFIFDSLGNMKRLVLRLSNWQSTASVSEVTDSHPKWNRQCCLYFLELYSTYRIPNSQRTLMIMWTMLNFLSLNKWSLIVGIF